MILGYSRQAHRNDRYDRKFKGHPDPPVVLSESSLKDHQSLQKTLDTNVCATKIQSGFRSRL